MSQQIDPFDELPDHLADTGPNQAIRDRQTSGLQRVIGMIALIGAAVLTMATALLLLTANSNNNLPSPAPQQAATSIPTTAPQQAEPTSGIIPTAIPGVPATLSPQTIAALMTTPIAPVNQQNGLEIVRNDYNPFTIIPDRPRSEVIQYEVQSGDTIYSIAQRYNIKPDTLAWSNDRGIVEGLRPGQELNILPIDGAYYTVSSVQSINSIAKQFNVDPYVIIDSEYNDLFGDTPDSQLPSNTKVVVPGGEAESINWNPPVQHVPNASSSGGSSGGEKISFDISDPGSCGLVENPGGSGGWQKPLAAYQWVRGFSSIHSGVDLSAAQGTPIMAATSGSVIFSGWSNWGYGYSVVVASGPFTEIYGHMVTQPSARCGSRISAGQVIGSVGMTGNATGPHLHFEIRYNDQPIDPTGIMAF